MSTSFGLQQACGGVRLLLKTRLFRIRLAQDPGIVLSAIFFNTGLLLFG